MVVASDWVETQCSAVMKYGINVDASVSFKSVPVQRKDPPPLMNEILAVALAHRHRWRSKLRLTVDHHPSRTRRERLRLRRHTRDTMQATKRAHQRSRRCGRERRLERHGQPTHQR